MFTRMNEHLCDSAFLAWTRLSRAHCIALGQVERALKEAGLPPLAWYDVLTEIESADEEGLRPFVIEKRLVLPQYALSRLLARIEEAGLIARGGCPGDGRGQIIRITEAGRAARCAMTPVYRAALQASLGRRLSPEEAVTLATLLGRLVEREDAPVPAGA